MLRGTNNSRKEDCPGIKIEVVFDDDYADEYAALLSDDRNALRSIPSEYYRVWWRSFAGGDLNARGLRIISSHVDATTIRLQTGTDYYLQSVIDRYLDEKEKASLSLAYRTSKESFADDPSVRAINRGLAEDQGVLTAKPLEMRMDITQRSNWDSNLVPHLDTIPFQHIGRGEQSIIKTILALKNKAKKSHVVLIEEPENHLSFGTMHSLLARIRTECIGKQLIIATHSAYVLNRLGIDKVCLLHKSHVLRLNELSADTTQYFMKLSGYDTLRLILAEKAILVEGPSDELIIQRAYYSKYGRIPLEDSIDVINVRGLSFKRFLEIAKVLEKRVTVVTDNDGNYETNVKAKYADFGTCASIKICADDDDTCPTLEPQIVRCNQMATLNKVFGTDHSTTAGLLGYMINSKSEWALRVLMSPESVEMPQYIQDAIG